MPIVNLLLAAGVNINGTTKRNKTALYAAVEKGNRRVVAALLPKCTCDDLRKRTNYGTDVLHIADRNGNRVIKGNAPLPYGLRCDCSLAIGSVWVKVAGAVLCALCSVLCALCSVLCALCCAVLCCAVLCCAVLFDL